jgi:hypothetical protein
VSLLSEWRAWAPRRPPFVLDGDRQLLNSERSRRATTLRGSWPQVHRHADFARPGDTSLHLGLLPQPFCGDLRRASIYLLLLNPGIGPHDYYAEYKVAQYRQALLRTIRQDFAIKSHRFLFLDPQFSWHGGFSWWHGKLSGVIQELAGTWDVSFAVARYRLACRLASVELLPYHSERFKDADNWSSRLHSASLARAFVTQYVLPKVRAGRAIVIVTRKAGVWQLRRGPGTVIYSGQEARAAHLSPSSRGGRAILRHLRKVPSAG